MHAAHAPLDQLVAIMAQLRNPDGGCPWDLEQDFASIAPYTIEEAYEVADAIERGDIAALKDELGDLLLQVVFHSRMAEEVGAFTLNDVIASICDKMRRRHPHVFGNDEAQNAAAVVANWEAIKAAERDAAAEDRSALAGVAIALPALLRAQKIQKRASRTGFDWDNVDDALAKLHEEIVELQSARNETERSEEAGDLLFAAVNICRLSGIDAENALKSANRKFERRFRSMEALAGDNFVSLAPDAKEQLWQQVKSEEKAKMAG